MGSALALRLEGLRGDDGTGRAGWCAACGRCMPAGPDYCLGTLPGVAHACCGHGREDLAYVVFGESDVRLPDLQRPVEALYGVLAARYFGHCTNG